MEIRAGSSREVISSRAGRILSPEETWEIFGLRCGEEFFKDAAAAAELYPKLIMTKNEVSEYLGRSFRSIAQYVANGKLTVRYVDHPRGRQAIFDRADVERLKREKDTPITRAEYMEWRATWFQPRGAREAGGAGEMKHKT